jgi:hypothetical protein
VKNYTSAFTAAVRQADALFYGATGASTRIHLHVTGQNFDSMSTADRDGLLSIIDAYTKVPEIRQPMRAAMWVDTSEVLG